MRELAKLAGNNAVRKELVRRYRQNLQGTTGLSLPFANRLEDSSHHIFPVLLDRAEDRQSFRQAMSDRGVQTSVHYPPVHGFTHYRRRESVRLPKTEAAAAREVTLPLHPLMTIQDVDAICEAARASMNQRG